MWMSSIKFVAFGTDLPSQYSWSTAHGVVPADKSVVPTCSVHSAPDEIQAVNSSNHRTVLKSLGTWLGRDWNVRAFSTDTDTSLCQQKIPSK